MNHDFSPTDRERMLDLLAERSLFGLTPEESDDLERLLNGSGDVDAEEFDRIAAALAVGLTPPDPEPMPEHLRRLCAQQARDALGARSPVPQPSRPPAAPRRFTPSPWLGWWAAAACLCLAVASWLRPSPVSLPVDVVQARQELLNDRDSITVQLDGVGPGSAARGDVVWNKRSQSGYMRLDGVAVNDPTRSQYQLWIFDKKQDERYPVDGGVFDVARPGELVLPIRAPIKVVEPYMFAVTVEKPGGVVVSARDPVVLLGQATTIR